MIKYKTLIRHKNIAGILFSISILYFLYSCTNNEISKLDFLIGTWKMEGQEQYEVWEKNRKNELIGYSFRLEGNEKAISETLSIKIIDNQIVYEATVPNQNKGKTIQFILNNDITSYLSFENAEHDFPKKIQYRKITDDVIKVMVSGDKDQGFSYTQIKQKTD